MKWEVRIKPPNHFYLGPCEAHKLTKLGKPEGELELTMIANWSFVFLVALLPFFLSFLLLPFFPFFFYYYYCNAFIMTTTTMIGRGAHPLFVVIVVLIVNDDSDDERRR